jgi:hypothetical protein
MRVFLATSVVASAVLMASIPIAEARPRVAASASCAVAGPVVTASGLPTGEVINFMVTDSAGTRGWVLGFTADGTWAVSVPAANGPTTYQFVSRTWGPNGSHYNVFATCS